MCNQYVSIVPECLNGSESAVWLCCACICEVNWVKFEKLRHSKWWMPLSGSNQTDASIFTSWLSVLGAIWSAIWVSVRNLGAVSFLQGKISMRLFWKTEERHSCVSSVQKAQCVTHTAGLGRNKPVKRHTLGWKSPLFQHLSNALIMSQCQVRSRTSPSTYKCKLY